MAELSFYVSDEVEAVIRRKAEQANMSLPQYLGELLKRASEVQAQWPEGYIQLFDDWQGEPLERPSPLR